MEQVDGQIADFLEDIRTFEKMYVGLRTSCNRIPQFLPVFFRAPLLPSGIERIIKITMVWINRDARDRAVRCPILRPCSPCKKPVRKSHPGKSLRQSC